jgi:hypothetical protein
MTVAVAHYLTFIIPNVSVFHSPPKTSDESDELSLEATLSSYFVFLAIHNTDIMTPKWTRY